MRNAVDHPMNEQAKKVQAKRAIFLANHAWYAWYEFYYELCLRAVEEDATWGQRRSKYGTYLLEGNYE